VVFASACRRPVGGISGPTTKKCGDTNAADSLLGNYLINLLDRWGGGPKKICVKSIWGIKFFINWWEVRVGVVVVWLGG
jgi:hypothetical protein